MSESPSSAADSTKNTPAWYGESRKKSSSEDGALVFTALRLLELPWQHYFLTAGLGTSLLSTLRLNIHSNSTPPLRTDLPLGADLTPYQTLILALAAGTSASQIFWVWRVRDNYFPPAGAAAVAAYNTLLNTLNSCLALWAVTSQAPAPDASLLSWPFPVLAGVPLYLLGTYLERYSEVQRKAFKAKSENKGKPYAGGLFGVVRNANYSGYTLMRTGFALICGGWVWGAVIGGMVFVDFAARAVPWLEAYCEGRYGRQWMEVKKKVPYRLIPGVF